MTMHSRARLDEFDSSKFLFLNIFLFVTGSLAGTALVCLVPPTFLVDCAGFLTGTAWARFSAAFRFSGRLLLLLYLCGFFRLGAFLAPAVLACAGMQLGMLLAAAVRSLGHSGLALAFLTVGVRLLLVVPFAFYLGSWALARREKDRASPSFALLLFTAAFCLAASALEALLAPPLYSLYFSCIGV